MNELTVRTGGLRDALTPQSFDQVLKFSELVARTQFVPAAFRGKPEEVLAAITYGAELGLSPMQSLRGIAVINGVPAAYGDTLLAVCQAHPQWGGKEEWIDGEGEQRTAHCVVKRKGEKEVHATFSVADAKAAGLLDKSGPWKQYRDRMMMFRARGFALRDQFADALRGIITAEEAQDYPAPAIGPDRARDVTPPQAQRASRPSPQPVVHDEWLIVWDEYGEEYSLQPGELQPWIADRLAACDDEQLQTLLEHNDVEGVRDEVRAEIASRLGKTAKPAKNGNGKLLKVHGADGSVFATVSRASDWLEQYEALLGGSIPPDVPAVIRANIDQLSKFASRWPDQFGKALTKAEEYLAQETEVA